MFLLLKRTSLSAFRHFSRSSRLAEKIVVSSEEAVRGIKQGSTVLLGGFGLCGIPENLLRSLAARPAINNLRLISIDAG